MAQDVVSVVHEIAQDLIRLGSTQNEIDGRFLFEVWDDSWIAPIKDLRYSLFGQSEPPVRDKDHSLSLPQAEDELGPSLKARLNEAVEAMCEATGLWASDVSAHVLFGSPLQRPRLGITGHPMSISDLNLIHSIGPRVVIPVFSDDVTGDEVKKIYENYVRGTLVSSSKTRRRSRIQTSQHGCNLVRTWSVMSVSRKAGTTQREAIARWNYWFPMHSWGNPKKTTSVAAPVTASAEGHFSRDKKRLLERLTLTI